MNGTYGFVYSSIEGVGVGVFRITGSELVGVYLAGGRYKGRAVADSATGEIDLSFDMTVPAGVFLMQGTSPQDIPYTKNASIRVPADFGDGKPFEVYVAPANVTLMVKRIPDGFAPYADGVTVDIRPAG
jgi:hypothetical protein